MTVADALDAAVPDDASGIGLPVIDPAGMTVRDVAPPVVVPETPPHCGDERLTELPVRVGRWTRDGREWRPFDLPAPGAGRQHAMVFGTTGSGKSVVIDNLLIGLAPRLHTALSVIDLKGVDSQAWLARLTAVATDRAAATVLLRRYLAEVHRRKDWCTRWGLAQLPVGLSRMPDGTLWLWPAAPLFVDEAREVTTGDDSTERVDLLTSIGNLGRAFAVTLVVATQHPEVGAVPTGVQQSIGVKVGLACSKYQQVEAGFGQRFVHDDPDSKLPRSPLGLPTNRGLAWVDLGEGTYRYAKFAFPPGPNATEADVLTKARCRAIAAGTAHLRCPNLGGQVLATPGGLVPLDEPWPSAGGQGDKHG